MPQLEISKVVLVHVNIVINQYQHDSIVWCTFVPNKSLGLLLEIPSPKKEFAKTHFIWSLHTLKYGLLIKLFCQYRLQTKEIGFGY